mgnify:CR=1 FL=1
MTDLDALHAALDAEPWSATLRLVIADELDALGDPLREGYRALGLLGRYPRTSTRGGYPGEFWQWVRQGNPWAWTGAFCDGELLSFALPDAWVKEIATSPTINYTNYGAGWREFPTRREADDAAAKAFTRLPAATQAAILETAGASV